VRAASSTGGHTVNSGRSGRTGSERDGTISPASPSIVRFAAVSPIRGRSQELSAAGAAIAGLAHGTGAVIIIEGPPGIGKTRLLAEVTARAADAGARRVTGRAYQDQQTVPFGPLLSATIGADPPISDLDVLTNLGITSDLGFWVVHELQSALSAAAAERPLVIAVDDIHWSDAGTLTALQSLTDALSVHPVLWVLAGRPAEARSAVRDALNTIAATSGLRTLRLRLPALRQEAVAEIAGDTLNANVDESLLELTGRAYGNPFLVLELLRGLHEEGRLLIDRTLASAVGKELPQRLAENMEQRLSRLSPETSHMVQVASVLPASFSVGLLSRMLDHGPARLLTSVAEAVRADLLTEDGELLRFRHDLLRQAARQSIPHALRRAMERESARILLDQGAEPAQVAAQLARSADVGDDEAVRALREASAALVQSDPSGAADLSLRAVDLLPPDAPQRPTVIAETVERLNRATRYREAGDLASTTVSGTIPEEAEALIRLSLSTVVEGYASARVAQNRLALELSGVSETIRARHHGYLAHGLVFGGLTADAREAALVALDAANGADDLYARMLAEITLANVDCATGHGKDALERIHRLLVSATGADEKIGSLAVVHSANLLMTLGQVEQGNTLCDMAIVAAQSAHHDEAIQMFTQFRARGELLAGRLNAVGPLMESLPEDQRFGLQNLSSQIGSITTAILAAHTDDIATQRLVINAVRPALEAGLAERRAAAGILIHTAWERGDVDEAARWLGVELDLFGTPPHSIHLDQIVIAARVVGISGDAGLRERLLTTIGQLSSDAEPVPVFAGVALNARGLLDQDVDTLATATEKLAESERPLLHAGAMEDTARLMLAHGDDGEAIERLNAAFDVFRRCGAIADTRRVGRVLQQAGVHRRNVRQRERSGWDSLTQSERRVYSLVVEGATSREVAEQLNVSPNTVNTHIRKVFSKLGVHSRAELVALDRGDTRLNPPS
jgi:DNA-binding CsgD family transcriptional regulator